MKVLRIAPWALTLALCGPIYAQVDVTIESDGTTRYASDLDVDGEHEVPTSTTLPATCNTGDVQVDTDEASGRQWFLCTATNTWTRQGGVLRTHATDCTSITDGVDGEACWEQDDDALYVCEPTAGDCDTPAEWVSVGVGGGGGGGAVSSNLRHVAAEPATSGADDCEFDGSLCGYVWSDDDTGGDTISGTVDLTAQVSTNSIYDLDSVPGKLLWQSEDVASAVHHLLKGSITLATNATIFAGFNCAQEIDENEWALNNANSCALVLCNETDGCDDDAIHIWLPEIDSTADVSAQVAVVDNGSATHKEFATNRNDYLRAGFSDHYVVVVKEGNDYLIGLVDPSTGSVLWLDQFTKAGDTTLDQIGFRFNSTNVTSSFSPVSTVDFIRIYDGVVLDLANPVTAGPEPGTIQTDYDPDAYPETCALCEEFTGDAESLTWEWFNQDSATLTLQLDAATLTGETTGLELRGRAIDPPSSGNVDMTWTAKITSTFADAGVDGYCGIGVLDGGTLASPTSTAMLVYSNQTTEARFSFFEDSDFDWSSGITNVWSGLNLNVHPFDQFAESWWQPATWYYQLRYTDSSRDLDAYLSPDGIRWVQVSATNTTLTADPIKLFYGVTEDATCHVEWFRVRTDAAGLAGEVSD